MCVDMIAADDIRGTFWYADQCIYHHHDGQPLVFNATLNFGARIEGVALQQWNIQQVGAAAEVTDAQLEAAVDEVIEGKSLNNIFYYFKLFSRNRIIGCR